jgi:hypothetical protein
MASDGAPVIIRGIVVDRPHFELGCGGFPARNFVTLWLLAARAPPATTPLPRHRKTVMNSRLMSAPRAQDKASCRVRLAHLEVAGVRSSTGSSSGRRCRVRVLAV